MTKRLKERNLDEIYASNIARLHGEATRLVPMAYSTLFKKGQEGRLETFGNPLSVSVDHLIEQYKLGFPEIHEPKSAA